MQRTIQAVIRPGEQSGYVAECPGLNAVTQGETLDIVAQNLREVIALALEGEDLGLLGFAPSPVIVVTFELEPAVA
ncbi:MAG: hypothetical protein C0506_06915 [Anaerolinea sp.]|nr:hypothetical protein [Anaerolinea sp.]